MCRVQSRVNLSVINRYVSFRRRRNPLARYNPRPAFSWSDLISQGSWGCNANSLLVPTWTQTYSMDKGNTQTLASCWSVNGNIEILWPGHKSGNTPHLLLTLPIDLRSYQQRPETAAPLRHAGGAPVSSLIVQEGLVHHWWELSELLWMVSKVIPVQPPMTPLSLLSQARVPRLQNNKTIAKCSQLRACGNVIALESIIICF